MLKFFRHCKFLNVSLQISLHHQFYYYIIKNYMGKIYFLNTLLLQKRCAVRRVVRLSWSENSSCPDNQLFGKILNVREISFLTHFLHSQSLLTTKSDQWKTIRIDMAFINNHFIVVIRFSFEKKFRTPHTHHPEHPLLYHAEFFSVKTIASGSITYPLKFQTSFREMRQCRSNSS